MKQAIVDDRTVSKTMAKKECDGSQYLWQPNSLRHWALRKSVAAAEQLPCSQKRSPSKVSTCCSSSTSTSSQVAVFFPYDSSGNEDSLTCSRTSITEDEPLPSHEAGGETISSGCGAGSIAAQHLADVVSAAVASSHASETMSWSPSDKPTRKMRRQSSSSRCSSKSSRTISEPWNVKPNGDLPWRPRKASKGEEIRTAFRVETQSELNSNVLGIETRRLPKTTSRRVVPLESALLPHKTYASALASQGCHQEALDGSQASGSAQTRPPCGKVSSMFNSMRTSLSKMRGKRDKRRSVDDWVKSLDAVILAPLMGDVECRLSRVHR